jgi:hypothetical protein
MIIEASSTDRFGKKGEKNHCVSCKKVENKNFYGEKHFIFILKKWESVKEKETC